MGLSQCSTERFLSVERRNIEFLADCCMHAGITNWGGIVNIEYLLSLSSVFQSETGGTDHWWELTELSTALFVWLLCISRLTDDLIQFIRHKILNSCLLSTHL